VEVLAAQPEPVARQVKVGLEVIAVVLAAMQSHSVQAAVVVEKHLVWVVTAAMAKVEL
jgi:hypothetical protein